MARLFTLLILAACFVSLSLCIKTWNPQAVGFGVDPLPGFYHDWVIFSRVNYDPVNLPWPTNDLPLKNANITTLRIINDGTSDLVITGLVIADPGMYSCDQTVPKTLAPGAEWEITLRFIHVGGDKGTRMSTLTIQSNDATTPNKVVTLAGAYLAAPEGGNEIFLQDIISVFGWTSNMQMLAPTIWLNWPHLSENATDSPRGDQWVSTFWKAADPNQPVLIREVASYQHCCTNSPKIELVDKNTNDVILATNNFDPFYGQAVMNGGLTTPYADSNANTKTSSVFYVRIEGSYTSTQTEHLGMHFYALRDRDGNVVPNAYIVPQDYSKPYYLGCLDPYVYGGYANCDFQDNIFVIWNIAPAGTAITASPSGSVSVTPTTSQSSTTTAAATTTAATTTTVAGTTTTPAQEQTTSQSQSTTTAAQQETTTAAQQTTTVANTPFPDSQGTTQSQETTTVAQSTRPGDTTLSQKPQFTTKAPTTTQPVNSQNQESSAMTFGVSLAAVLASFVLYILF